MCTFEIESTSWICLACASSVDGQLIGSHNWVNFLRASSVDVHQCIPRTKPENAFPCSFSFCSFSNRSCLCAFCDGLESGQISGLRSITVLPGWSPILYVRRKPGPTAVRWLPVVNARKNFRMKVFILTELFGAKGAANFWFECDGAFKQKFFFVSNWDKY